MKKGNLASSAYRDVFLDIERSKEFLLSTHHAVFYKFSDQSMKYSYFSPAIEELTGYTSSELTELGFDRAIQNEVFSKISFYSDKKDKAEADRNYFSRYWIETKNDGWKLIENYTFLDDQSSDKNQVVTGFMRDVTSLNNYILNIIREKERLNSIIELAEVMLLVLDKNGNVEMVNKKACDVLGYDREEIIGKNWIDNFVPGKVKEKLLKIFDSVLTGEDSESEYNENPVLTKNHEERYIAWHNKEIRDNEGNILFILASGEDLTERKNEEKIQQLIANILEASNSESDINEFFKYIHKSIGELIPAENFYIALYDKSTELISFPYFIDKYDSAIPAKKFGKGLTEYVLRNGRSALITKEMDDELVKAGETEIVGTQSAIWLGIPLKISDFTIGALVLQDYDDPNAYTEREQKILEVIAYSISRTIERKRLEEERRALIKKLEKLNSSKDKLFSLISHDLRSPFNSLLGFSEILKTEFESLTPGEVKEYIRTIYDSSKNLYGMTNNLLHFSRFQMGKIECKPTTVNLKKIVTDSLRLLHGNIIKKQLNVKEEVNKNVYVFADEEMLASIIQNLISNAIKFTNRRGDIKVYSTATTNAHGEGMAKVIVEDSGVGISETDLKRIQEGDFYTYPGTEKEYGTGLGLQLVKDFIVKNGGSLSIESKVNVGSTFSFTVPLGK